ncbi:WD repeat-containing protein 74-like [Paramacrobiotus metropolitanus]|uniref:WD repeat-containing protein 74-like n=1 Tax=Paramacrobiotus metropolitanus TaxID=2943436 RepID=UPI002445C477|nr:WD repeat-containing protein 74-like [Paramacrobiotus metropolitanus]
MDNLGNLSAHLYIGCDTGLLKGIRLPAGSIANTATDSASESLVNKDRAVDVLFAENASDAPHSLHSHKLRLCLKNRDIVCLNVADAEEPFARLSVDGGEGRFVGGGMVERNTVTAVESGHIFVNEGMQRSKNVASAGVGLARFIQGRNNPKYFASGGRENHLKLWDLSAPASPVFTAKNLPDDKLRLTVPTFIRALSFRPSSDDRIILTATGYHQVQLYDTRVQRRPLRSFTYGEDPLTSLDVSPHNPDAILLANRLGKVALFDWRGTKALPVRAFTGSQGSVKQALFHPREAGVFGVIGMDRYLRVYRQEQKAPVKEVYLKSQPLCLLWTDEVVKSWNSDDEPTDSVDEQVADTKRKISEPDEDDGVWNTMQTVDDQKRPVTTKITRQKPRKKSKLKD